MQRFPAQNCGYVQQNGDTYSLDHVARIIIKQHRLDARPLGAQEAKSFNYNLQGKSALRNAEARRQSCLLPLC